MKEKENTKLKFIFCIITELSSDIEVYAMCTYNCTLSYFYLVFSLFKTKLNMYQQISSSLKFATVFLWV